MKNNINVNSVIRRHVLVVYCCFVSMFLYAGTSIQNGILDKNEFTLNQPLTVNSFPRDNVNFGYESQLQVVLDYHRSFLTDVDGLQDWELIVDYTVGVVHNSLTGPTINEAFSGTVSINNGEKIKDFSSHSIIYDSHTNNLTASVEITAICIEIAGCQTDLSLIPDDIRLELKLEEEKFGKVQSVFTNPKPPCNGCEIDIEHGIQHRLEDDELLLYWTYLANAEEYDLEWVYIDAYDQSFNGSYGAFEHKSPVRITTNDQFYRINMTYPEGKIYYRYRGVGKYEKQDQDGLYSYPHFGNWISGSTEYSYNTSGAVTGQSTLGEFEIGANVFENAKTWQSVKTYAEDGKSKEVINFYDKSNRNRQTLTNLNTEDLILIAETKYDYEGRGKINILPAPIGENDVNHDLDLSYKSNFNKIIDINSSTPQSFEYDKSNFDKSTPSPQPLDETTGAGKYYSSNNDITSINSDYIPKANGHPYTKVDYTRDNTGRVKGQSGIGATHKMNAGKDTKYLYGSTNEQELRRLFADNVGDASHYRKMAVKDPNGQYSITYQDQEGRTIATCLAGPPPGNLNSLDGLATETIFTNLAANNQFDPNAYTITSVGSFINLYESTYTFNYDLAALLNLQADPCYTCTYELSITVQDPDGLYLTEALNPLFPSGRIITQTLPEEITYDEDRKMIVGTFNPCDIGGASVVDFLVEMLYEGTYIVTKNLSLVQDYNIEQDPITLANSLGINTQEIIDEHLAGIDLSQCDLTCEDDCYRDFIDGVIDATAYDACVSNCAFPSYSEELALSISEASCEGMLEEMKEQLRPGGYYFNASNNNGWWTNYESIINSFSVLNNENGGADENTPPTALDMIDNTDLFTLELEVELAQYHPEYCHYEICLGSEETQAFNLSLGAIQNWDQAVTAGYTTLSGLFAADDLIMEVDVNGVITTYDIEQALEDKIGLGYKVINGTTVTLLEFVNPSTILSHAFEPLVDNPYAISPVKPSHTQMGTYVNILLGYDEVSYAPIYGAAYHNNELFYYGLQTTDLAEVAEERWRLFRSLYIAAKQEVIDEEIIAIHCATLSTGIPSGYLNEIQNGPTPVVQHFNSMSIDASVSSVSDISDEIQDEFNEICISSCEGEIEIWIEMIEYEIRSNYYEFTTNENVWIEDPANILFIDVMENIDLTLLNTEFNAYCLSSCNNSSVITPSFLQNFLNGISNTEINNSVNLTAIQTHLTSGFTFEVPCVDGEVICTSPSSTYSTSFSFFPSPQAEDWIYQWLANVESECPSISIGDLALVEFHLTNFTANHTNLLNGSISISDDLLQNDVNILAIYNLCSEIDFGDPGNGEPCINETLFGEFLTFLNNSVFDPAMNSMLITPGIPILHNIDGACFQDASFFRVNPNELDGNFATDAGIDFGYCDRIRVRVPGTINDINYSDIVHLDLEIVEQTLSQYYVYIILNGTYYDPISALLTTGEVEVSFSSSCCLSFECDDYISTWQSDCIDFLNSEATYNAIQEIQDEIDEQLSQQYQDYVTNCYNNIPEESFTCSYTIQEGNYTLYYYDQAGNLVQTVAPEGVDPGNSNPVGNQEIAQHNLRTRYQYNALNQVAKQITPDGGETFFWYDDKGMLRLSQNARQKSESIVNTHIYSYTKYDYQGRIIEVGEMVDYPIDIFNPLITIANKILVETDLANSSFPNATYRQLEQITRTVYDVPNTNLIAQENLRNRVSSTFLESSTGNITAASHYSYDEMGNVKSLVQEIPGFGSKKVDYEYELVSGNVSKVIYQKGQLDQMMHKYEYDADNRLTNVYTSQNGKIWDEDAEYFYYAHGPLARAEIGEDKIQGLDYYYTIHGWLKGINMPNDDAAEHDLGSDGWLVSVNNLNKMNVRDEYGLMLGYYQGDYQATKSISLGSGMAQWEASNVSDFENDLLGVSEEKGLYNGNIALMTQDIAPGLNANHPFAVNSDFGSLLTSAYQYDQLNRIKQAKSFSKFDGNNWSRSTGSNYDTDYTYDNNGNIEELNRYAPVLGHFDEFSYNYTTEDLGSSEYKYFDNKLLGVNDNTAFNAILNTDIDDQGSITVNDASTHNYTYDEIGNLTKDVSEEIDTIIWTVYGKVSEVVRIPASPKEDLRYEYDAMGNRIVKIVMPKEEFPPNSGTYMKVPESDWKYSYYLRDASGNSMATVSNIEEVFVHEITDYNSTSGIYNVTERLYEMMDIEYSLYGSSRLGVQKETIFKPIQEEFLCTTDDPNIACELAKAHLPVVILPNEFLYALSNNAYRSAYLNFLDEESNRNTGDKFYELSNHLGNVNVVVSDKRVGVDETTPLGATDFSNTLADAIPYGNAVLTAGANELQITGATGEGLEWNTPLPAAAYETTITFNLGTADEVLVSILDLNSNVLASETVTTSGSHTFEFTTPGQTIARITIGGTTSPADFYLDELVTTIAVPDGSADYYLADVVSATDYYPFGMRMPGRIYNSQDYSFGFQRQEMEDELWGGEASFFKYRISDNRLGKFVSVDPLSATYPWNSPYAFSENRVIDGNEIEGLEWGPLLYHLGTSKIARETAISVVASTIDGMTFATTVMAGAVINGAGYGIGRDLLHLDYSTLDMLPDIDAVRFRSFESGFTVEDYNGDLPVSPADGFQLISGVVDIVTLGASALPKGATLVDDVGMAIKGASTSGDFASGGTHLTTQANLAKHADSPNYGGVELFVAPTNQIDELLKSGKPIEEIDKILGLKGKLLDGSGVVRIDFDASVLKSNNLRLPTGAEAGVNSSFKPGGQTSGGVNEAVIDAVDKTSSGVSTGKL